MPTSRAIDLSPCLQLLVLIASLLVIPVVNTQETVAVRTTITATPTAPHPPSYTSLDDFKTTVLRVTNAYRQSHDARPLVWNESLGDYAGNWADRCIWQHSVCLLQRSKIISKEKRKEKKSKRMKEMIISNNHVHSTAPMAKTSPSASPTPHPPSQPGATKAPNTTITRPQDSPKRQGISHNWYGNLQDK